MTSLNELSFIGNFKKYIHIIMVYYKKIKEFINELRHSFDQ